MWQFQGTEIYIPVGLEVDFFQTNKYQTFLNFMMRIIKEKKIG
jgi:hypothetical protein